EQMLLAGDVVVDRRLAHAEFPGEVAHAGAVVPLPVEEFDRVAQHGLLVVARAAASDGAVVHAPYSRTGVARARWAARCGGVMQWLPGVLRDRHAPGRSPFPRSWEWWAVWCSCWACSTRWPTPGRWTLGTPSRNSCPS